LDTPFTDLYYYVLMSDSMIDRAVKRSLDNKELFNENSYAKEFGLFDLVKGGVT
jgi:hypothetical protein